MAELDHEALQKELEEKQICRFCLTQNSSMLTNIFLPGMNIKSSAPLHLQIMAIASIEVFCNDGMPPYVCCDCFSIFEYSYQFKQMCLKADNLLRRYPFVGNLPKSIEKPTMPQVLLIAKQYNKTTHPNNESQPSLLMPKKILNLEIEQYVNKSGKTYDKCSIICSEKTDINEELPIDDIQPLVSSDDVPESKNLPILSINSSSKTTEPNLLNKSSVRILDKYPRQASKPQLSVPKRKREEDKCEEELGPRKAEPVETNIFPCPKCERTFPLLQLRDLHVKQHFRDRNFQCEECDKTFLSKNDLCKHLRTHPVKKPFVCLACGKAFSRSNLLRKHEDTHTDVPKHICVYCERSFISKEDMERHVSRHNIKRPFQCKICKKGFAFKQGLTRHEVVHSLQQPYPCQYCEESFNTASKLTRHLTAHAGLRPYPCKFCKKSYLLNHHLTRHLRSHNRANDNTSAVVFMCSTCKASFESRDQLIQHSKTHADEENLDCCLCKETFDNMSALISHIQDHAKGESYACEFCDLIFLTAEKLQLHTDFEHAEEMVVYHEDDAAKLNNIKEEVFIKEEIDIDDEKLQITDNVFVIDELLDEGDYLQNPLKRKIKTEEETSPIIDQTLIQNGNEQMEIVKVENNADDQE